MTLGSWAHRVGRAYLTRITTAEHRDQRFHRTNERTVEYRFVFEWLNRLQPRTVLDVGTGQSALPALVRTCGFVVTAIDNVEHYWPKGMVNRHWRVEQDDVTKANGHHPAFDVTLCISVLEHISNPMAAVTGLYTRTVPGGVVLLTTPFGAAGHPNVYTLPSSYGATEPYICRQSCPADLADWLRVGFTLDHAEYWQLFQSPYWSVGSLQRPPLPSETPAHLGCFVLRRH